MKILFFKGILAFQIFWLRSPTSALHRCLYIDLTE
jgi:hypothetical protein